MPAHVNMIERTSAYATTATISGTFAYRRAIRS
jgi:hypothetical protein